MKLFYKRLASIILATVFLVMTGCSTNNGPSAVSESNAAPAAAAAKGTSSGEGYEITNEMLNSAPEEMVGEANQFSGTRIAFSQRNIAGSEWWEQLVRVAKLEAEHLGIELTVLDGENNLSKQISDIETLISMAPDAMIINPFHSTGVLPAVNKVHAADIPLTVVNCALDSAGSPFTFVSTDVFNSGYQSGFALAKAYDEKNGWKDEVKALLLSAAPQEEESDKRRWGQVMGYNDYMLEKYGKTNLNIVAYKYYNWQPEPAMNAVSDVFQANPDIEIIFAACDGGTQGAIAALEPLGKVGQVLITSIDARRSVLQWISEGNKGIVASVSNDPRVQGKWAVYLAAQAAAGNQTPSTFYVPNPCYTKDNVGGAYDPDSMY